MRILLLLFITLLIFSSCKEDPSKKNEVEDKSTIENTRQELTQEDEEFVKMGKPERSLPTERALAQSKLDKYHASKPAAMQMLTSMIYEIDYVMKVKEEPKKLSGYHFDFRDDFSYEWVKEGKLAEKGKYFYGMENDLILLLPDNEKLFPSEWKLKSSGLAIVFAGTSTFSNNSTQMHMVGKER